MYHRTNSVKALKKQSNDTNWGSIHGLIHSSFIIRLIPGGMLFFYISSLISVPVPMMFLSKVVHTHIHPTIMPPAVGALSDTAIHLSVPPGLGT